MNIRVLLADDHKIVREGLLHLLEKNAGIEVVAEADNGRSCVRLAVELQPDVIIMDLAMPELNGIEATRQIIAENGESRVIALSMHSDKRYVVEALSAGAKGYLLKDCAADELIGAIRSVAANGSYLSSKITGIIIKECIKRGPDQSPAVTAQLSSREREVLQLLAEGKNTKEIAFTLDISGKTVETHRKQIMKKLNLHSIAELTKYALREGLTSIE